MRIVVAGASGLIGRALVPALQAQGHEVVRLVRRAAIGADEIPWQPASHLLDASRLEGVDAVVNLAGENIAGGRWTAARRAKILASRVNATRTLVTTCAKLKRRPSVFINASAIGIYGDRGDAELTEVNLPGLGFLPEVCLIWETNAEGASRAGVRTVLLRFGVVLSRDGGALVKMLPLFRLGLGGPMGAGRQWMSWVSLGDAVGAVQHALTNADCTGAVNVVAPGAVMNSDFAATLARVMNRPAALHVPDWSLRLLFGQMAGETVLASTRALPKRLQATGYVFHHPSLEVALRTALRR